MHSILENSESDSDLTISEDESDGEDIEEDNNKFGSKFEFVSWYTYVIVSLTFKLYVKYNKQY